MILTTMIGSGKGGNKWPGADKMEKCKKSSIVVVLIDLNLKHTQASLPVNPRVALQGWMVSLSFMLHCSKAFSLRAFTSSRQTVLRSAIKK